VLGGPAWVWRLGAYALLTLVGVAAGAWATYELMNLRYERLEAQYEVFVVRVTAEGRVAEERRKRADAVGRAALRQMEVENEKALVDINLRARDAERRMRDAVATAGAGRGVVPDAAKTTGCPEGAVCFDRAQLAAGIGTSLDRFAQRFAAIFQQGDTALADLRACVAGWDAQVDAIEQTQPTLMERNIQ